MTKQELLSNHTAEQLAEMVVESQNKNREQNEETWKQVCKRSGLETYMLSQVNFIEKIDEIIAACFEKIKEMTEKLEDSEFKEIMKRKCSRRERKNNIGKRKKSFLETIEKIQGYTDARAEDLAVCGADLLAGEVKGLRYVLDRIKDFEFEEGKIEDLKELNGRNKEEIDRLKTEVEKYRKAFDNAKKERDRQVCEYQKKIEELAAENKKYLEQIMASIPLSYGYSVSEVARAIFEHCNSNAFRLSNKNRFDYSREIEKAGKDGCEIYILGLIKCLQGLCNGENYTEENLLSKFLPTEPIKVAEILITANRECEPLVLGNDTFKDTYRIFDISDLRQIAEHLLVYCNHHEEAGE